MAPGFFVHHRLKHQQEQPCGQCAAQHGAKNGDPAVVPATVTLARDRQEGMGAARAEVTGRIHRVAGRSAQGHAQGHDQAGDRPGADGAGGGGLAANLEGVILETDGQDDEHEQRGGYQLGKEVPPGIPDGRHRAESAEHGVGLFGSGFIVVLVEHVDQQRAHETAQHLGDAIAKDHSPSELAGNGQTQGYGRIEVRAGDRTGDEHAHHHGETPGEGDYDPSAAFRLGFVEGAGGANAVTEEDKHEGAEKLENVRIKC